jgi:RNA polymerase primary sigma factor
VEELAEELDASVNEVRIAISTSGRTVSSDAPFSSNEDTTLTDVLFNPDDPRPDDKLMSSSLSTEIERALSTLTVREKEVVTLFYGIGLNHGYTLEEIGEKYDLTRERVRQIKEKAIRRLRNVSRSRILKTYLG